MQSNSDAPQFKRLKTYTYTDAELQALFNNIVQAQQSRGIVRLTMELNNVRKMIALIQYNHYQNLIHVIQTNYIDGIDFFTDLLDNEQLTQEALISTAPRWLPLINSTDTFERLVDEMTQASRIALFPLLLEEGPNYRIRYDLLPLLLSKIDMGTPKINEKIPGIVNQRADDLILSTQDGTMLKIDIFWKLTQYIDSVEQNKRPGFRFFKERQTENRMINCELAKQLKIALETSDVKTVFSDVMAKREQIRQGRQHAPWFNWMGSNELKQIIHLGQRNGKF